jgi:hypothetical protein
MRLSRCGYPALRALSANRAVRMRAVRMRPDWLRLAVVDALHEFQNGSSECPGSFLCH